MKGKMKRLLAFVLTLAMIAGNAPAGIMLTKAAVGDTTVIRLGRPTTGAVSEADGTEGGVTDDSAAVNYLLRTSYAGDGWKLNMDKTDVPTTSADPTLFEKAGTSSGTKNAGMFLQKWNVGDKRTALHVNYNKTVALDFTVPEDGLYKVEVRHFDHKNHRAATAIINGVEGAAIPGPTQTNAYITTDIGIYELRAGAYANTIELKNTTNTYYSAMFIDVTFTKVADLETPTEAPTETPTETPTEAPTEGPGAPTMAPSTGGVFEIKLNDYDNLVGVGVDPYNEGEYGAIGIYHRVAKNFGAKDGTWRLKETTIPFYKDPATGANTEWYDSGYTYSANKNIAFVLQHHTGVDAFIMKGTASSVTFEFTVAEAGYYMASAKYFEHTTNHYGSTVLVNGIKTTNAIPTTDATYVPLSIDGLVRPNGLTHEQDEIVELGLVYLNAGTYANTVTVKDAKNYRGSMVQGFVFEKVDDSALPTMAPTATPAPTVAPTATPAPTPKPTPKPTEDPNAVKTPFMVSVKDIDANSVTTLDGERFYFTKDTVGANWAVHSSMNKAHLLAGTSTSGVARVYLTEGVGTSIQLFKSVADFVLSFTAPSSGYYDLSSVIALGEKNGYGDIYVNNEYVGSLNGYINQPSAEQKLLGVYLNGGELNNTIKVKATGKSHPDGHFYFSLKDFVFTTPEEVATLKGAKIVGENSMFVGDTQTLVTNGDTTNDALYRFSVVNAGVEYSSNKPEVATVEADGTVKAIAPGKATITANIPGWGYSDTLEITVVEVKYETPEINIQEGWIFTEGDSLVLEPKAKCNNGTYIDDALVSATYDSSDEAVAKIENGVLKAIAPGQAKITAHVTYNGTTLDVEKNIKVNAYVPPVPFEVTFEATDNLVVDAEGTRFYVTKDSTGPNWKVSSKNQAPLAVDQANPGKTRIYYTDYFTYLQLQQNGKAFVIDVDVPIAGAYDISANIVQSTAGGYVGVYVNDVYVGTVDCYVDPADATKPYAMPLLGVNLHAGVNTIGFKPLGISGGEKYYTYMYGFSFTTPEEIAKITAIDAKADVEDMYIGREEQISVETILTNGGYYDLAQSKETLKYETSNASVATVSDKGVIKGVGAGEVTITVTAEPLGLSDTITFDVSGAAYEKVELNITEGELLYVMAERELAVNATLADGTPIAQKDLTITYTSSDESVAKVEEGILKVVGKGNAAITADVQFNVTGETKTDVKNIVAETIPLTGITAKTAKTVVQELDWDGVQLIVQGVAEDGTIIDDLEVAGFTQRDFTYESLTPEIMSIDVNGVCKYVSRGVAKIKVTAVLDGVSFEQVVEVVSSSQKTGRTLYTPEMVENARYNAKNTKWGVKEVKRVSGQSFRFVYSLEHVYDLIFAEGIPRSYENATIEAQHDVKWYCPACGVNIEELYKDKWESNILENPWKIWCAHCKTQFPTNDFELLYKRGLDENGQYNRDLAIQRNAEAVARGEKDALVNELYPDRGPLWMVDDGYGWSPTSGTYGTTDPVQYTPVAKYAYEFWYNGPYYMGYILYKIRDIYMWTGDERYAIAGCILLDRVADVYPTYDVQHLGINYAISHGGGNSGKIVGSIHENYLAQYFAECYDAFYPEFDRPEVIEFLSRKAVDLGLDNPKTNGNLIRENIENGILRETMKAVRTCEIYGNFGFHQAAMAKAAVALDTQPETNEAITWLTKPSVVTKERRIDPITGKAYNARCENTGGEYVTKYVNEIDRDGFGAEVSVTYNKIWLNSGVEIADVLKNYDTSILDLYANPKFVNMYDSFIYETAGDGYMLALGDGGKVCEGGWTTFPNEIARGYRALRTPILAQVFEAYRKGDWSAMIIDFYTDQKDLIVSMQKDLEEHGKLKLESRNLTGYGLAMVRGGTAGTKSSTYETRYDTWMYYGRTEGSHAHWNMLQLGIDAYGFNFTPDQGYPEATGKSAHRYEWVKASISHNLVLVNEDSQTSVYTGYPLHFDSTDNVKLMDVEAPHVYEDTEIYRRTAITISANDDVAYTVDLFRVKGGNAHTYNFITQGYKGWSTNDLNLVPQVDEHGNYIGTYASPDWEYGNDPLSTDTQYAINPVYPRGYTWITEVNRGTDKTGDGVFTIDFKQTNFKHQVADAVGLALKVHGVNDWVADSIDIGVGTVTRKLENEMIPGLDQLLIQRRGENLDTLFATVLEPYKINSYITKAEPLTATIVDGTEGENDLSKVIKVTLNNNRIDYIIYATNKNVTYNVTDGNVSFDFKGFVGVYTTDYAGNNIYSYVNDGTIIGNMTGVGAYTGTVVDFTKELVLDDYIIIKPEQEVEDVSALANQYIYVEAPESKCNGSYRIISAEKQGENIALYLGNCSLIEGYIDDYNLDAGFVYTIADGARFEIPVSTMSGVKFSGTNRPNTVDSTINHGAVTSTEEVVVDVNTDMEDNYVPNEGDDTGITDITEDPNAPEMVEPTATPEGNKQAETGEGTPTPTPENADANAGGKGMRNILLGGLGVLALGAGLFLILLGKKKDEEEA